MIRIGMLPGTPGKVRLCLARHESPIDCRHVILLRDRKNRLEGAASRAGHILRAEDRTAKMLERKHGCFKRFGLLIAVKRYDVRLAELHPLRRAELVADSPVPVPHSA